MSVDIKSFLFIWCQKNSCTPTYESRPTGPKHRQRFLCEVRVPDIPYVGVGNSTNKKDAEKNASRDFVNYLVRIGKIPENSVPKDAGAAAESSATEATQNKPQPTGPDHRPQYGKGTNVFTSGFGPQDLGQAYRPYVPSQEDIKREQANMESAESLDVNSSIHGNWTIENARSKLNQWMQHEKVKGDFKYTSIGPDHAKSFIAELTVFVKALNRSITGRESGSNKQSASKSCALSIVRQLYHLGVIEAFNGSIKSAKTSEQVAPYVVRISQALAQRVHESLMELKIQPVKLTEIEKVQKEPISLLHPSDDVHYKPQTMNLHQPSSVIPWSPPQPNWNPWLACNIDEGYLATATLDQLSEDLLGEARSRLLEDTQLQASIRTREKLPIASMRKRIMEQINEFPVVLIRGNTGCGKTTQIAQFILEDYINSGQGAYCNVCVTQPRRISAISVSERIANERCENLGVSVGYSVRFDSVLPRPFGSILFCTIGVLLRKLEAGLRGVSHVIVDEIHERDVNSDFILVVLRDMVHTYPDLRVILMSATIDTTLFSSYFGDCPVLEVQGRTFPVQQFFLEDCIEMLNFMPPALDTTPGGRRKRSKDVDVDDEIAGADGCVDSATVRSSGEVEQANLNKVIDATRYSPSTALAMGQLQEAEISFELIEALVDHIERQGEPGAVLVFLAGWNMIFALMKHLQTRQSLVVLPLHSQLPREDQRKVFDHYGQRRKVILATNIAETSITIDDVVYVIDTCKARMKLFTSHNNMTNYATVWAAKTNLEQRKGRAGRVSPGKCYTLCSRARFDKLEDNLTPEMFRTPLHELALSIKLLRLGAIGQFLSKAIEPPPLDAVIEAEVLLKEMRCLDEKEQLTPFGRILARLPLEPRLGKMMVLSTLFQLCDPIATMAAYSGTFSEIFLLDIGQRRLAQHQRALSGKMNSDYVAMLSAFDQWSRKRAHSEEAEVRFCEWKGLQLPTMRTISEAKKQLMENLTQTGFPEATMIPHRFDPEDPSLDLEMTMALLCVGLYPNVCFHKEKRRVLTTESKAALIHKTSVNCSQQISFPYPFFVFGEKIRTRAVSCKQMSMVTPIHLLLFGCKKVEWNNGAVRIDDWLNLDMDPCDAAMILALRPCLQDLLVRISADPEDVQSLEEKYYTMLKVVRDLCAFEAGDFEIDRPQGFASLAYGRKIPRVDHDSAGAGNRYGGRGYSTGGSAGGRGRGGRGAGGWFSSGEDRSGGGTGAGNNASSYNNAGTSEGFGGNSGSTQNYRSNFRYFHTGGNVGNSYQSNDNREYGSGGGGGVGGGFGAAGHSGNNRGTYRGGYRGRGGNGGYNYSGGGY
ncbi:dosage compensation regulator [Anopheles ziemanni]|uniref:dosage compensation regulator n=1 Tax=Anopheles coustani TaxID=139045 RepID=UPI0026585BD1|nr:dosage compensation regulator [Anopheles coustani]XP_058167326.1 dosage compensation regulator [Anopheles ziemanni]